MAAGVANLTRLHVLGQGAAKGLKPAPIPKTGAEFYAYKKALHMQGFFTSIAVKTN
jgi:hypothetical protein